MSTSTSPRTLPTTTVTETTTTENVVPSTTELTSTTSSAPTTATSSADAELPDIPLEFLQGVYESDYDLAVLDEAIALTAPRSPAWYFARLHRDVASATLDWATWAGPSCEPGVGDAQISCTRVTRADPDVIEVCDDDWGMMGFDECGRYTDFELVDGKVTTFKARGLDIESRLGVEGDAVSAGPVSAQVTSSYLSIPDDTLSIAFVITRTAGAPLEPLWLGADSEYVDPAGTHVSGETRAIDPIAPEMASAVAAVVVHERAEPGGTLYLSIDTVEPIDCSGDGSCEEWVRVAELALQVEVLTLSGTEPNE